jgi:FAD/FMN-containing dehydrogenase
MDTTLSPSYTGLDLEPLRTGFSGPTLIAADGDAYDAARVGFNAMFDRLPAVIARAASTADVAHAIRFAVARGLPLAVRAGGHSVAGYSTIDDGLLLDLGLMKRIQIDPAARLARVEPGVVGASSTVPPRPTDLRPPEAG